MRVRIIKDHKQYKQGEIVEVSPNVAHGLIDGGVGLLSKDVTSTDISSKIMTRASLKRTRRK